MSLTVCGVALLLIIGGGKAWKAMAASNATFAAAHAGHEQIHAEFAKVLGTVEPGDLLIWDDQVYVYQYSDFRSGDESVLRYRPPNALTAGGEADGMKLKFLAERHVRVVKAGTPEYNQELGTYFTRITGRNRAASSAR